MPNMSPVKIPMPSQDAAARSQNFCEVALGYTPEQAVEEAKRCLNCKNKPCVGRCPVTIDIPAFIQEIARGRFEAAHRILRRETALPAVCGRVCPQESQCEGACVRGIKGEPVAVGRLERFAADWHAANARADESTDRPLPNGMRVAVVGAGPAGLTCAGELAQKGYQVTVFEALHTPGGVLMYGIPEFRLPKGIVRREIDGLEKMGVRFMTDMVVGRTLSVDELMEDGYQAVFLGTGAGLPRFMNIPGENLSGVYSANEFLTRVNLMKAYQEDSQTPVYRPNQAVVVGGGNVAMDAARCARRLGAKVTVVYRRAEKELPARREEVEHAMEEGIRFHFLASPVAIRPDETGWVSGVSCEKMALGEPDASGRARFMPVPDSGFHLECDCVIMAIGTSPNPLIKLTTDGLATESWGGIVANAEGLTSRDFVYAGGDAVTGAATVILAMGAGKTAANAIDRRLRAI